MLEGQNLSGQLPDWSIDDLLQIMQVTKKTASLDIEGERRGRVHFVDGSVTGAELSGDRGTYRGSDRGAIADILYVLSTLETGSFSVGPAGGHDAKADGYAVDDIMGEVAALRSLEGEVVDAGLFEAPGVRLIPELDEPITMEPDDWHVLVSLVQPFTFDFLESRVGRGGAVRIFHTLHRLGVAEAFAGDDESEWLDKLAGGLAAESSEPTWLEQVPDEATPKHMAPEIEQPSVDIGAEDAPAEPAPAEPAPAAEPEPDPEPKPEPEPVSRPEPAEVKGVSAHASTTLTDGVYDEIRRLRSKVADR